MIEWKYPERTGEPDNLFEVTPEMLSTWKLEYEECNEANDITKKELHKSREDLLVTAALLFGKDSNVERYLKKQRVFSPSRFDFTAFERKVKNAKEQRASETREIEKRREKERVTEKAINWLTEHGKTIGVDFTLSGALSLANGMAFENEVAKQIQEIKRTGEFVTFQGDDNCENCKGWDGERNRCECGTRRVGWEKNRFDTFFLFPLIYGQAY
ncbi:hypothetical protein KAU33_04440 [Candidatus Dependentiae bacterium]|nr:hypothetical protein [Candidatus Dependentiae bacterium]